MLEKQKEISEWVVFTSGFYFILPELMYWVSYITHQSSDGKVIENIQKDPVGVACAAISLLNPRELLQLQYNKVPFRHTDEWYSDYFFSQHIELKVVSQRIRWEADSVSLLLSLTTLGLRLGVHPPEKHPPSHCFTLPITPQLSVALCCFFEAFTVQFPLLAVLSPLSDTERIVWTSLWCHRDQGRVTRCSSLIYTAELWGTSKHNVLLTATDNINS